jgi:hypothetical protein
MFEKCWSTGKLAAHREGIGSYELHRWRYRRKCFHSLTRRADYLCRKLQSLRPERGAQGARDGAGQPNHYRGKSR